jgi:hypothetical protein
VLVARATVADDLDVDRLQAGAPRAHGNDALLSDRAAAVRVVVKMLLIVDKPVVRVLRHRANPEARVSLSHPPLHSEGRHRALVQAQKIETAECHVRDDVGVFFTGYLVEYVHIGARPAGKGVYALAADELVVGIASAKDVVAGQALDRVPAVAASERIVTLRADEVLCAAGVAIDHHDVRSAQCGRGEGSQLADELRWPRSVSIGVVPDLARRRVVDDAVGRVLPGGSSGAGEKPLVPGREVARGPKVVEDARVEAQLVRARLEIMDAVESGSRLCREEEHVRALCSAQAVRPASAA